MSNPDNSPRPESFQAQIDALIRRRNEEAARRAETGRKLETNCAGPMRELQPVWNRAWKQLWTALAPLFEGHDVSRPAVASALVAVGEAFVQHDNIPWVREDAVRVPVGWSPRGIAARLGQVEHGVFYPDDAPKWAARLLLATVNEEPEQIASHVDTLLDDQQMRGAFGWMLPIGDLLEPPGDGWNTWQRPTDDTLRDPRDERLPCNPGNPRFPRANLLQWGAIGQAGPDYCEMRYLLNEFAPHAPVESSPLSTLSPNVDPDVVAIELLSPVVNQHDSPSSVDPAGAGLTPGEVPIPVSALAQRIDCPDVKELSTFLSNFRRKPGNQIAAVEVQKGGRVNDAQYLYYPSKVLLAARAWWENRKKRSQETGTAREPKKTHQPKRRKS